MKNNKEKIQEGSTNYDLKSDAVEKLVGTATDDKPVYSQEELDRYRSGKKFRIPEPVKILFIKAWFAGAVCFFFLWGLGTYVTAMLDMLFILGVVLGMVTDLLVNHVIRFMEKYPGQNDKWMLFPKKGMMSFFLNVVYGFLLIYCVYSFYNLINSAIVGITGNSETVPLGVEPVLFGVFCMAFDMLFISIKRAFMNIINDAKNAAAKQSQKQDDSST